MLRLPLLLAAAVISAAGCLAAVGPATALPAETGTASWTLAPAADEAGPRTSIHVEADDKTDVAERVVLTNTGDEAADFVVRAADATNDGDGLLVLQPAARPVSETGAWILLPEDPIRLEAGASLTIPVTIDLPPGAPEGDHIGGIIAGLASEDGSIDLASAAVSPVVWVSIRVSGIIDPTVAVAGASADYHASWNPFAAGELDVSYSVANAGNVALDVERTVIVSGPFGLELARLEQDPLLSLLPGQYVDVAVRLPGILPVGFTSTRIEMTTSEPGSVVVEEDEEPEPTSTPVPTSTPTSTSTPAATETPAPADAEETPAPTETAAAPSFTVTYPTASATSIAVAISWTLLALVVVGGTALLIARRAVIGTRERRYLMIDEAIAARDAAAASAKAAP